MANEVIFITARQAYQQSLENYDARLVKNRQQLRDLIDRATKVGEFQVIYDRPLADIIITWLTENFGYKVEKKILNDNEKEIWIISWEHAN